MDMHSRQQYLTKLKEDYRLSPRKDKTKMLDEFIRNTGHNRKYAICKFNSDRSTPRTRKKRKLVYGTEVNQPLAKIWAIFDYPCGQRLNPIIQAELDRLIKFGEIIIPQELALKLKKMSSATIDRRLTPERKRLFPRRFSTTRPGSLLKHKIPVRLTQWDTTKIGYVEADLVAHCGDNVFGNYINTLSVTEIATGWWEGEAIMGKGQMATFEALKIIRARTPFFWKGLDSDNGGEFINAILAGYCRDQKLEFTRSRANKKNDNAYVEQKNWTHVRKLLGYQRYDTPKEMTIINSLYRNEIHPYKNFFQPVMKLKKKERVGSVKKRKYEPAKTPFQRIIESNQTSEQIKAALKKCYEQLNPAELKRRIDSKLELLYLAYSFKQKTRQRFTRRREVARVRF